MNELTDFFTIQTFELMDEQQKDESESRSLIYRERLKLGHRFEFMLTSTPQKLNGLNRVMGGLNALRVGGDFSVKVSGVTVDTGVANKPLLGIVPIGTRFAEVADTTGIEVGKYFKFSGHSKVYQVTSVGTSSFNFFPNAIRAAGETETLLFDDFGFTMRLRGRIQNYSLDGRRSLASVRVNVVESF